MKYINLTLSFIMPLENIAVKNLTFKCTDVHKYAAPWIPITCNMCGGGCVWSISVYVLKIYILIAIYIHVLCREVDFETYMLNILLSSVSVLMCN
jgi:hypothetical protein